MGDSISLAGAFLAGLQSFLSPGFVPLIPGCVACVVGLTNGLPHPETGQRLPTRATLLGLAWATGFSAVFIALAATASTVGQLLLERLPLVERVGGLVLAAVGLALMGATRPALVMTRAGSLVAASTVGGALAFGWTPRLGPLLDRLFMLSAAPETLGHGLTGLLAHAAGLALPCVAASVALSATVAAMRVRARSIGIACGICLVGSGLLIWMALFPRLAEWIAPSLPTS